MQTRSVKSQIPAERGKAVGSACPHLPAGAAPLELVACLTTGGLFWRVANTWPGDDGCLQSFRSLV